MTPDMLKDLYPEWTIWELAGIWYATGSCSTPNCGCRRTLHSQTVNRLAEVLAGGTHPRDGEEDGINDKHPI